MIGYVKKSLFLGILGLAYNASAQYSGKVFVDQNRNGIFDKNEKVLSDVCVSDGLNVVKTNNKGIYNLSGHEKNRFIFITTPSGYKTNNAYYQRIQEGVKTYDFGVMTYNSHVKSDGSHKFIHISDTEIGETQGHDDWIGNIRDYAANENISFIIQTGDICYENGLRSHIKIMNTSNMGLPVFYTIGNHDLVAGKYGEELFEKLYGPVWYSFDVGSVHYIVTPMRFGDYTPSYYFDDVCRWVKNDLAMIPKGKPIIVFNHDLLCYDGHFVMQGSGNESVDFDSYNMKAQFYGHWHINHVHKHDKAYSVCTAIPFKGGIDHASTAFRVLSIDKNGDFSSTMRYSYFDKSLIVSSIDNQKHALTPDGKIPLFVNTYKTVSPTKQVSFTCSVDGKEVVPCKKMQENTDFCWSGYITLPAVCKNKLVVVNVEAEYANGEIEKNQNSFFYNPNSQIENKISGKTWTNLLGNACHLGIAKDTLSLPLQLNWVNNVGANIYMASPIIKDDLLYVASIDENIDNKAAVYCLNAMTGKILWRYKTEGSIKNTISIESGNVFAQDIHGNLYAINAMTGKLSWKKKLQVQKVLPALIDGLVTNNGKVYAGTGYGLTAFEAATGDEIWRNTEWMESQGCTGTLSVNDEVVIGSAHWGALHANDVKTGKHLWEHSDNGLRMRSSAVAIKDGLLYVLTNNSICILESVSGEIITQKSLGFDTDVASTPLITDDAIIFGTAERGVVALDRITLNQKWAFRTKQSLIFSSPYTRTPSCTVETSPVLSGDVVYVAASDGIVYALDRKSGKQLWKYNTGAPIFTTPAIIGNSLYLADYAGNVYSFVSAK